MKIGPDVPNCYYRVSIKALITNDEGKILAVNERGAGWELPGGGLEWGEDAVTALRRELQEEIGCNPDIEDQPIMIMPAHAHAHKQHVLWIVYRAHLKSGKLPESFDAEKIQFMTTQELRDNEEAPEANWESPIDFWEELQRIT